MTERHRKSRDFSSMTFTTNVLEDEQEDETLNVPIVEEKNIVVMPLDASENSLYAMQYYVKHIHRPDNMVHACYVSEQFNRAEGTPEDTKGCCSNCKKRFFDKVVVDVGPSPGMLAEWQNKDRANYHRVRHRVKHMFRVNDVKYEIKRLTGPDPATAILEFRKEIGGTMILMGSRGQGAFKRRVFGSVSDKVLKNCLVPVLVVKKPHGAATAEFGPDDTGIP